MKNKSLNNAILQALQRFLEEFSQIDSKDLQAFDGVFHVEGNDQPIILSSESTIGDIQRKSFNRKKNNVNMSLHIK